MDVVRKRVLEIGPIIGSLSRLGTTWPSSNGRAWNTRVIHEERNWLTSTLEDWEEPADESGFL